MYTCLTLDVQTVRRRLSSGVYAEREQHIVLSHWQHLSRASEPRVVYCNTDEYRHFCRISQRSSSNTVCMKKYYSNL